MATTIQPSQKTSAKAAIVSAIKSTLHWRTVIIWLPGSLLATYSGPFGTYDEHGRWELFLLWSVLLAAATLVAYVVNALVELFLRESSRLMRMFVFTVVAAGSIGAVVQALLVGVFGYTTSSIVQWGTLSLYALAVICFIVIIRLTVGSAVDATPRSDSDTSRDKAAEPDVPPASLPPHSRLAIRLDIPQGHRISQITAKGHFVSVETCSDEYSTRMRFSDAVAELDGTYGLTVHRSHWVHRDSIVGWVPCAKKPFVLLRNMRRVPISKTYLPNVKSAGLKVLELDEVDPEPLATVSS